MAFAFQSPPSLLAGQTYTFSFENASMADGALSIEAGPLGTNSYAGGVYWHQGYSVDANNYASPGDPNWDATFRTNVGVVPEPMQLGLLGAAFAIGWFVRRRCAAMLPARAHLQTGSGRLIL